MDRSPKILIVDDIPKNIQVVGNILQEKDYDIYFANDGKTAINQARNNDFDLILLDIMMPEMDGFEVCEYLKRDAHTQDVPIIFLTAKTDSESTVKGFKLGGVDYITKPFNGTELLARIETHLNLKFTRQRLEHTNKQLAEKNMQIEKQQIQLQEAYEKLSESEKHLRELNATKDKFFSIVAHDLKNPFNTLIGFSDVLVNNYDALGIEQMKEIHQHILSASRRGFNLLENLLEWSRAQTGRIKWKPEIIDLKDVIGDIMELLVSTANSKQIELIDNIPENSLVFADNNMINTVIRNLISNALKFTLPNGKVIVSCQQESMMRLISVEDNGLGISDEDQQKLFRIDVNHSTVGTADEKGTGLGLILCKEFIEKNNGTIWIESQLGKGSKFIFTLPVANEN